MSEEPANIANPAGVVTGGRAPRGALVVLVLAFVFLGMVGLSAFAAGSTIVCTSCHAAQATALAQTSHKGISCERCHFAVRGPVFGRTDVGLRMVPASLVGVRLISPGALVGNGVCISCHPKMVTGGVITKKGLRIDHTACTADAPCESCHGLSMHGTTTRLARKPSMADCIACHTTKGIPRTCPTCHVDKASTSVLNDPELARTHGPDWKKMHGTGDLGSCVLCHGSTSCRRCHKVDYPHPVTFGATHGPDALRVGNEACLSCHLDQAYCDACHGTEMPHPAGYLQAHSKAATSVNDPACARCHVLDDCAQCHIYHVHPAGPRVTPGPARGI